MVRIDDKTSIEEIEQLPGQLLLALDLWFSDRGDEEERSHRALVQVWRLTFNHLDHHDTDAPDVNFVAVLFSENQNDF